MGRTGDARSKSVGRFFCFRSLWAFFLQLFFLGIAQGQVAVKTMVSQSEVGLQEAFELRISVITQGDLEVSEPSVPLLQGLRILRSSSSTAQSAQISIVNGQVLNQVHRTIDFVYLIQATELGRKKIPPFSVTVGGRDYRSEEVPIQVLAQAPQARSRPPVFDEEEEDPTQQLFQQLLQRRGLGGAWGGGGSRGGANPPSLGKPPEKFNPKELFFLYADVDKKQAYVGEQVTVTWSLYTRGTLKNLDRLKFPDLKGFWKEIIEEVPALTFQTEILQGVRYDRALLASHALFPMRPGTAVIDEYKVRALVISPNQFGLGDGVTLNRSSERLNIQVLPLPPEGRPAGFSGAVGQFSIQAQLNSAKVALNQAFSLKLRIEGRGNAKTIEFPQVSWPDGLEFYDKKEEAKFFKDGTSMKEFEVLLLPRKAGALEIPSIELSFFNPETRTYAKSKSQSIPIEVQASATENSGESAKSFLPKLGSSKGEKGLENPADEEMKTLPAPLAWSEEGRSYRDLFRQVLFLSLFLAGILLFLNSRSLIWKPNEAERLRKNLKLREKKIRKLFKGSQPSQAVTEALNACVWLVSEILKSRGPIPSGQDFRQLWRELSVDSQEKLGPQVLQLHRDLEAHAFAPEALRKQLAPPEELVNQLLKLCFKLLAREVKS